MDRKESLDADTSSAISNQIDIDGSKKNLANKKIYFDSEWSEIKIGYEDETGVGFVEIIGNH